MAIYVDGFVVPVPKKKLDVYRRMGMLPEVATTLDRLEDLDPGSEASGAVRTEAAAIRAAMREPRDGPADERA